MTFIEFNTAKSSHHTGTPIISRVTVQKLTYLCALFQSLDAVGGDHGEGVVVGLRVGPRPLKPQLGVEARLHGVRDDSIGEIILVYSFLSTHLMMTKIFIFCTTH